MPSCRRSKSAPSFAAPEMNENLSQLRDGVRRKRRSWRRGRGKSSTSSGPWSFSVLCAAFLTRRTGSEWWVGRGWDPEGGCKTGGELTRSPPPVRTLLLLGEWAETNHFPAGKASSQRGALGKRGRRKEKARGRRGGRGRGEKMRSAGNQSHGLISRRLRQWHGGVQDIFLGLLPPWTILATPPHCWVPSRLRTRNGWMPSPLFHGCGAAGGQPR